MKIIDSLNFLKELLEIAKRLLEEEKQTESPQSIKSGKSALTELFNEVKNENTHVIVERIVEDIDKVVSVIRFDGWQATSAGEREVKKALRLSLAKYQLHKNNELFDKAYEYIKQYY